MARLRDAVSVVRDGDATTGLVAERIEDLDAAITAWTKLDAARLRPRRGCSRWPSSWATSTPAALLTEQAAWERETRGGERKALVARLYAQRYLADRGPLRGIDADTEEALERFDELADGALQL